MYIYIHTHIYMYICINIHTYIHIHTMTFSLTLSRRITTRMCWYIRVNVHAYVCVAYHTYTLVQVHSYIYTVRIYIRTDSSYFTLHTGHKTDFRKSYVLSRRFDSGRVLCVFCTAFPRALLQCGIMHIHMILHILCTHTSKFIKSCTKVFMVC